jgi:chromosome segregation ATPase
MKSHCLEMAYQESLQNAELIVKDETSRRLRLRIILLENENDEMHLQLASGEDRIDGLEEENEDLRAQLDHAREDVNRLESELRVQGRDLKNVKVNHL